MDSWQPIMTPFKIIAILVIVAVLFIPAGCGIFEASKAVRLFATYPLEMRPSVNV
jgi:hypothetical protein